MPPYARTVMTSDQVALHVVELGPARVRPVVVLHGGPAAHHDYLLPAMAELADNHRLVLYDQRGGGKSRVPAGTDVSFSKQVEDVGTIFASLNAKAVDLIGYSFGGLWALLFAAKQPHSFRKCVLVSSVPPWHAYRENLEQVLLRAQSFPWVLQERAVLERAGLRDTAPDEYRRRRFALSVAGYFVDPRLAFAMTPFHVQANTAEAILQSLGAFDFRHVLSQLDGRRMLFIHGDSDPVNATYLQETARQLGASFELLPNCGHVPFIEAPVPFFAMLKRFLQD